MSAHQAVRVQRRRTKGWCTPTCGCGCGKPARYVGRGSKWGNPWVVSRFRDSVIGVQVWCVDFGWDSATFGPEPGDYDGPEYRARAHAVAAFEDWVRGRDLMPLRGHDLMCWCPLEDGRGNRVPCHADVLLEIANQGDER